MDDCIVENLRVDASQRRRAVGNDDDEGEDAVGLLILARYNCQIERSWGERGS